MRSTHVKLLAGCAIAAVAASGLTACGSSGSSGAGGGGGGASSIKVTAILTTSSAAFGFPEQADGMKAYVNTVNAKGGVNGHKIDLTVCNNQATANTAAACAQQAVADKSVAVLGGTEINGPQVESVLQAGKVPYLNNPTQQSDSSSSVAWNVSGGSLAELGGMGISLVKNGHCRSIDLIADDSPSAKSLQGVTERGVQSAGGIIKHTYYTSSDNSDYGPLVANISRDKADCVGLVLALNEVVRAIPVLVHNAPGVRIGAPAPNVPAASVTQFGSQLNGMLISGSNYPPSSSLPGVVAFRVAMKKSFPKAPTNAFAEQGWGTAAVLVQALRHVSGPVDAASLTKTLGTLNNVNPAGVGPKFSFATKPTQKAYERLFNSQAYIYTVQNGKFVSLPKGQTATFSTIKILGS